MIFPSNSPARSFPDNNSSDFTIPLFENLLTPDTENWRVGLMQIQIPMTYYNVEEDQVITVVTEGNVEEIHMPEGIYYSPQDICSAFNEISQTCTLSWENTQTVIRFSNPVSEFSCSISLARLLGIPTQILQPRQIFRSPTFTFDPWINHKILFLHCSLVEKGYMNTESYRLLQTFAPSKHRFGVTFSQSFNPVEFVPILGKFHSAINFRITDIENRPVRFRSGNVILTIAFDHD